MNTVINILAFILLTLLWIAFAAALLFDRVWLDRAWRWFLGLPIVLKIIVGLLFLPLVIALWVWQTTWPVWLKLLLVAGLAWVTVYTFFLFPAA